LIATVFGEKFREVQLTSPLLFFSVSRITFSQEYERMQYILNQSIYVVYLLNHLNVLLMNTNSNEPKIHDNRSCESYMQLNFTGPPSYKH
jgi:hypothetical protein